MKKPMNRRPLFHKESIARMTLSAMVAMGSMLGGPQARAVTYTWNTTTGNWSVAGDWLPASVPSSAAGNDLLFSGGSYVSTQDTGAAFNLLSLRFTNSGAVTLAGSATNIIDFIPVGFNPFLLDSALGNVTISAPVTWGNSTQGASIAIGNTGSGALAFTGNQVFTKGSKLTYTNSGTGTIQLGGPTYTQVGSNTGLVFSLINNNAAADSFLFGTWGLTGGMTFNISGSGVVKYSGTNGVSLAVTDFINVLSGGTFDLAGNSEATLGGLRGAGTILSSTGTANLGLGGSGYADFSGALNTGASTLTITATATVQRLSGSSTYTGVTSVLAGTLVIGANAPSGSAGALGNATSAVLLGSTSAALNATLVSDTGGVTIGLDIALQTGNTGVATVGGTNTAGIVTYTGNITLGTAGAAAKGLVAFANAGGTTVFTGNLLRAASATGTTDTLTKLGNGTVVLQGTDTFTGATLVNAGILRLDDATQSNAAKLSATAALTLAGGSLDLIGNVSASSTETVSGLSLGSSATSGGDARITITSGNNQNATLAVNAINRSIGATADFGLTNTGTGVAAVTTSTANSANGIIGGYATVNKTDWAVNNLGSIAAIGSYAATLVSGNNTSLSTGTTLASGGATTNSLRITTGVALTFDATTPGTLTLQSGGLLMSAGAADSSIGSTTTRGTLASTTGELIINQHSTAGTLTINSVIGGTNVTKSGDGTLILTGTNTYTGALFINAGTVQASAAANWGAATSPIIINGGTMSLPTGVTGPSVSSTTHIITVGPNGATFNFAVAESFSGNGLGGSGQITKTGGSAWSVGSNASTFTGPIAINAGTLKMTSWQFGSAASATIASGATFEINDDGAGNWNLPNGGRWSFAGSGASGIGAFHVTDQTPGQSIGKDPAATISNEVVLQISPTRFQLDVGSASGSNSTLILTGNVTGPGGLTKAGPGLMILSARDNSYAGPTIVEAGTLRTDLGSDRLPTGTSVTLGTGTTSGALDLNGHSQNIAGLTTAGAGTANRVFNGSATTAMLTVNYNGAPPQTYSGIVTHGVNFVSGGTGTTILSGANAYTGTTTVASGSTLTAGGTHAFGDSAQAVTVNTASILDLAGQTLVAGKPFTLAGGSLINSTGMVTINTAASTTLLTGGTYAGGVTPVATVTNGGGSNASIVPLLQASAVSIVAGSTKYSINANVTFTAPPAGGIAPTAGVVYGLTSASFTSITGGSGYVVGDTLALTGGSAIATVTSVSSGAITGVSLTNAGSGYAAVPTGVIKSTGSGIGTLTLTGANATNFTIAGVTITTPGYGYITAPTVTISAPNTGGTAATATATSTLDAVTFSNGGTGYTSTPTVTFTGGTTNATATGGFASINLTANSNIGGDGNLIINPVISSTGAIGLTKIGIGTTTLAGNDTYDGVTTISNGTLQVGAGRTSGSIIGDIVNNAALVFNRSDPLSYMGTISNSGSVAQNGSRTLSLTSSNTYIGPTNVNSGTLQFTGGTTQASAVAVSASAALSITNAGVTAATLLPSLTFVTGTTTLNLTAGSSWNTTTPLLTVGTLTLNGTTNINLASLGAVPTGLYELIGYTALLGGNGYGAFNLPLAFGARSTATLFNDTVNNFIGVNIVGDSPVWTGATDANWDSDTTQNWKLPSAGTVATFLQGDTVQFDDSDTGSTDVALGFTANPNSVTFNNSIKAYSISGVGKISGAATLFVTGTGTVVLATDNDYTGTTTISSGTLQLGNGGTTGSVTSNIVDNGALIYNLSAASIAAYNVSGTGTVTQAGSNMLTVTGNWTHTGGTTISTGTVQIGNGGTTGSVAGNILNNSALIFNRSDNVAYAGNIAGTGTVTKLGAGTLTLTGSLASNGTTTITAGALQVGNGGTSGSIAGTVANNGALIFSRSDTATFTTNISGTGGLTANGGGTIALTGNFTYGGATTITAPTTLAMNIGGTSSLGGNISIPSSATWAIDTTQATDSTAPAGPNQFIYGKVISGAGSIVKNGTGTLKLTGATSFTGTVTINAGTMLLADPGAGTGTSGDLNATLITINNGGVFQFGQGNVTNENPDFPNTTYITANAGSQINWLIGETFGGVHLQGGAVTLAGGNIDSAGATNQSWTSGTVTTSTATANIIGGAAPIDKTTSGTVAISGLATIASIINLKDGTIALATAANLGSTAINLGTSTTTGILDYQGATASRAGAFTYTGNGKIKVDTAAAVLTLSGTQSGAGGLVKDGAGSLAMTATTNSYAGGTTILAGTVNVASDNQLGTGGVTLSGGAMLATNNIPSFTHAMTVVGSTGNTLGVAMGKIVVVNGSFTGDNTMAVTVGSTGNTGVLALAADNTAFAGGWTIAIGGLRADNTTNATGSGTVLVNGGMLFGMGKVGGAVTLTGGGSLSAGKSTSTADSAGDVGKLTVATLQVNGGSFVWKVTTASAVTGKPGVGYDSIAASSIALGDSAHPSLAVLGQSSLETAVDALGTPNGTRYFQLASASGSVSVPTTLLGSGPLAAGDIVDVSSLFNLPPTSNGSYEVFAVGNGGVI